MPRTILAALSLASLPGCVFAVDGTGAPASAPKLLEANGEAAVTACGAGQVALVTAKGYACKGAPDTAIDALREDD